MSTTVTYKGSTIATAENQTKTLLTEGKYLEDDITIVDVTSGGGGSTLITKNISANGTYNASSDNADGYSQVNVAVPNTYTAGDEGKVVSNGALVSQTAHADVTPTTSDQTIDTTTNNSIKVKGDADLVASNIKKDVEIFGITGSYEGSGGGSHARQAFYLKFYPAETYTSSNKLNLQLEASSNCYILVRAVSFPTPDSTQYKALIWGDNVTQIDNEHVYADAVHRILRPNGTIGTDGTQCEYNRTTGVLSVGGQYGHYLPEDEYEVIQVVFE